MDTFSCERLRGCADPFMATSQEIKEIFHNDLTFRIESLLLRSSSHSLILSLGKSLMSNHQRFFVCVRKVKIDNGSFHFLYRTPRLAPEAMTFEQTFAN